MKVIRNILWGIFQLVAILIVAVLAWFSMEFYKDNGITFMGYDIAVVEDDSQSTLVIASKEADFWNDDIVKFTLPDSKYPYYWGNVENFSVKFLIQPFGMDEVIELEKEDIHSTVIFKSRTLGSVITTLARPEVMIILIASPLLILAIYIAVVLIKRNKKNGVA